MPPSRRSFRAGSTAGAESRGRVRLPSPLVLERGAGAHVWDVDGNRYCDYLLALGPTIHGHAHPVMTDAVTEAIHSTGTMFAPPYPGEADAARRSSNGCRPSISSASATPARRSCSTRPACPGVHR